MRVLRLPTLLSGLIFSLFVSALWAAGRLYPAPRIRQELDKILAGPEYDQVENSWLMKLLRKIGEWLEKLFGNFQPDISGLYAARPVLYWAIVSFLVILLIVLIYHIVLTIKFALHGPRRKRRSPVSGEPVSPDALRAQAIRLAAEGQTLEALRVLYEAALRQLDRLELLRYDPARTGFENLAAMKDKNHLLVFMRPLNQHLEGFFYGGRKVSARDFDTCLTLANQAWELEETA